MTRQTEAWLQVHFVSAHEALLGRLCLRGKLSPKQKEQLHQRTFPEVDPNDIEPEQYQKAADKLFAKSGMPELEQVC